MIDPETELLLEDMLDNARWAVAFTRGLGLQEIGGSRPVIYATTRAIEIVGEAASKISPEVRASLPTVPWRRAIDMRNRLVHGYRNLDPATILKTVREDFPPLIAELERLLSEGTKP